MAKIIRIREVGGPEKMILEEAPVAAPGAGEARVRHAAVGVNFVDVYHRTGLYPLPLPSALGVEAAGVVEAVGPGAGVAIGDRVAYLAAPGSYVTERTVPADRLVRLPDAVTFEAAAAGLLKGLTVHMLVTRYRPARGGEPVVVTAAAGGVGQILVQWLAALGAEVIAVVGSPEKLDVVRALGAAHALVTPRDDVPARVKAIAPGGVPVVYDSVGKASFEASLDCLAPFGLLVSYGNASGAVAPFDTGLLSRKGSLAVARPSVFHHVARRTDLEAGAAELFARLADGRVKVAVGGRWPLAEAAAAHRALESRATRGSLLLQP